MADPWQAFRVDGQDAAAVPTQGGAPDPWAPFRVKDGPQELGAGKFAAPSALQAPESAGQTLLKSWHENELAAMQGVNPHATSKYFPSAPENKPARLGLMEEFDNGPMYKGPTGEYLRINPQTDFVAPDPDNPGQMAVYARTPQTNEKWYESLGRLVTPMMATGPLTGVSGASSATNVASHAPGFLNDPLKARIATDRAAEMLRDVSAFDRMGVPKPPAAFMDGPTAALTRQMADLPLPANPIRGGLDKALAGAAEGTEGLASAYGATHTPEGAGAVVRQGLERFKDARPTEVVERAASGYTPEQISGIIAAPARDTSLKTKQAALYERAWNYIPEEMRQGRAVEGLPRVVGDLPNARSVLQEIQGRNARMLVGGIEGQNANRASPIASGGMLGGMVDAIMNPRWRASLQTMRDIRSDFRRLASGMSDTEKNTLRLSDIERVQSAVTRDMIALLERNQAAYANAGNAAAAENMGRAINGFRRADNFTRLSMERMDYIEKMFNAPSAEALYRNVMQAAQSKGKGDLEKLRILRRTLRPEEMDNVAAASIRQMGEPVGSARGTAQEFGFSPSSALTRWNNMTPEARHLLFGTQHAQALDDWFRVVNRLANVEAHANVSKSGIHTQNIFAILGAGLMAGAGHMAALTATATGAYGLTTLLSRPEYVRWLTTYANLRAAALRSPGLHSGALPMGTQNPRLTLAVNQLGRMASRNPELVPIYRGVAADNGLEDRILEKTDQKQKVKN